MLAKVSVRPFAPVYELLEAPHSLEQQSKCGRQPDAPDTCGPHASGCGMAWRAGSELELEKRGPDDRWDQSFTTKVRSLNTVAIIAHNRLASPGLKLDSALSHPFLDFFRGAPVAFCHNGGVYDLMEEAKALEITDSQLYFRRLLSSISTLDHTGIASALKRFADQWRYTSLTALLLTPEALHVCRCYDANDARKADFEKYYTLWLSREASPALCVASEPVDTSRGWELLPNRTLLTVNFGEGGLVETRSEF